LTHNFFLKSALSKKKVRTPDDRDFCFLLKGEPRTKKFSYFQTRSRKKIEKKNVTHDDHDDHDDDDDFDCSELSSAS
tara:strand:+ start:992 stop:1222 length:231 start_codon:yes stop_codon:yes gene_type:complete